MSGATIERLLEWLERDPERLERHLIRHPADADRLDEATALTEAQHRALRQATDVPAPALDRLRVRLISDPASSDALRLMSEMFGVAWDTVRLMGNAPEKSPQHEPPPQDPRPEDEG
jgi:hypothetical protein